MVIGTSGLTATDYAEIDEEVAAAGVGVLAAGRRVREMKGLVRGLDRLLFG